MYGNISSSNYNIGDKFGKRLTKNPNIYNYKLNFGKIPTNFCRNKNNNINFNPKFGISIGIFNGIN